MIERARRVIRQPSHVLSYLKWQIGSRVEVWQEGRMETRAARALSKIGPEQVATARIESLAQAFAVQPGVVEEYVAELKADAGFQAHISDKRDRLAEMGLLGTDWENDHITLYALVRLAKPHTVLETGVEFGASSAHILRALERNRRGQLYSVDLPRSDVQPFGTPEGLGCMVPESLRGCWQITWADSRGALPQWVEKLGVIDLFLHDSVHTYDFMNWEYETVWPRIATDGCLMSHDVWRHDVFRDFCLRHAPEIQFASRVFNLGFARRNRGV